MSNVVLLQIEGREISAASCVRRFAHGASSLRAAFECFMVKCFIITDAIFSINSVGAAASTRWLRTYLCLYSPSRRMMHGRVSCTIGKRRQHRSAASRRMPAEISKTIDMGDNFRPLALAERGDTRSYPLVADVAVGI